MKDDIKIEDIKLQKDEVYDVKFVNIDLFNKMYNSGDIIQSSTEYFKMYIERYMKF